MLGGDSAQPLCRKLEPAVIRSSFIGTNPSSLRRRIVWIEQPGYFPQVLPGVL
jgi:hypothetical protein